MNKTNLMLPVVFISCFTMLLFPSLLNAQIDSVFIETYYVADAADAFYEDEDVKPIETGAVTYRVFVDLAMGSRIMEIFGNETYPLKIKTTEPLFNNTDRGKIYGYKLNNNRFTENTVALDSWVTLGFVGHEHIGIPKVNDPDGTILDGNEDGLLTNAAAAVGIPLTTADGLVHIDSADVDSTVNIFGNFYELSNDRYYSEGCGCFIDTSYILIFDTITGNRFNSTNSYIRNNTGIMGPTALNRVLIAQVTTTGVIDSFLINLKVQLADSSIVNYVATDTLLNEGTVPREFNCRLEYPSNCISGCTNPWFVQFNPKAVIDDGSCMDSIHLGCPDPDACNYDPEANWPGEEESPEIYEYMTRLCCYDNRCGLDLDFNLLCPDRIYGCMDPLAVNYDPQATLADTTCCYITGCMNEKYVEYDPEACFQDSTYCKVLKVYGCMDPAACNYNPVANDSTNGNGKSLCKYTGCENLKGTLKSAVSSFNCEIYPNPASGKLNVKTSVGEGERLQYEIMDVYGRKLGDGEKEIVSGRIDSGIDISGIADGIYLIRIRVNDRYQTKWFVKN